TLSGDFGKQRFTLRTKTTLDTASVQFTGVPYLSRAHVAVDADLDVDLANGTYTLRDNSVRVNGPQLNASGTVDTKPGSQNVNVVFEAPRTDFKDILSLVPAIYAKDFASVQTTGNMSLKGRVRGPFGNGSIPGFTVAARIDNASFRY